jgi:hypothetical protein
VCFLQRKINIQLKYFPEKFGNSGESNSCPSSPIKRSKCWRYGHAPSWKFLIITCKILHILSMSCFIVDRVSRWFTTINFRKLFSARTSFSILCKILGHVGTWNKLLKSPLYVRSYRTMFVHLKPVMLKCSIPFCGIVCLITFTGVNFPFRLR